MSSKLSYGEKDVHPKLHSVLKELEGVHRELGNFAGDSDALRKLQGRLNNVDNARVNGAFVASDESTPYYGQAALHMILQSSYTILRAKELYMEEAEDSVHEELRHIHHNLQGINAALMKCKGDSSLLPRYQGMLDAIDNSRVRGAFVGVGETELKGDPLPGQGVLIDLLNDAYTKVHSMVSYDDSLTSDKAVSPELQHTHRLLLSLRAEIDTFHGDMGGLRRIQGRLHMVEKQRVNGKFIGAEGGEGVPEGQAALDSIMNECYEKIKVKIELMESMDNAIHPSLKPIKKELDGILRDLHVFASAGDETTLRRLQGRLNVIDSARVDGRFVAPDAKDSSETLPGQAALHDSLNEAYHAIEGIQKKAS